MTGSAVQRATLRFKQLSCMGLGGEAVMPALIREMHNIVPSLRNMFFFAKPDGTLDHIYTESMEFAAITQLFVTEFNGRQGRDIPGFRFEVALKSQVGVHDLTRLRVDINDFGRSEFYNECFRPVGRGKDYIRLVMRDQGQGVGMLTSFREPRDSHFTETEKNRLASLEPFFVHAIRGRRVDETELVDSDASGLIVADVEGRLLYASASGRELLLRVTHPKMAVDAGPVRRDALPGPLRNICRTLGRIMAGDDARTSPAYHHRNLWGGFTFRANLLRGEAQGARVVGITITHQEPAGVKLVRRIGELALSGRQSEICLELAQGFNYDAVSEKLGISKHTAVAHSRALYDKLGVHNRSELRSRLLEPSAAP